jgi:hypothetical protein
MQNQKGLSTPLLIGIIALVVLVGAVALFGDEDGVDYADENIPAAQAPQKVSGSSAGVQPFSKAAYDKANAEGKLIIVFFDSSTCGEPCTKEIRVMKSVFADYADRPIAGFIADINQEKAFANSLKIFASVGKALVFKNKLEAWSPLSWTQFDYENYIEIYTYGPEDE